MKKVAIPIVGLLLAISFVACQKETLNTILEASKTNSIKKGEPVIFILPPSAAGNSAKWSVNPSSNTQINARGDSASILFGSKGNYTVTATFGNSMATSSVSVTDTAYMDTANFTLPITFKTLPFAPGEVIKINLIKWPINRGLDSGATAALIWFDETTNNYGCLSGSYLNSEVHQSNSGYTFKYNDVTIRENCSDGTEKATGDNFLYPIPDGTSVMLSMN